jgi:hypothetical protein
MKFFRKTIQFLILFCSISEINSQDVPVNFGLPACFLGLVQRTNLSVFGDSRIARLSENVESPNLPNLSNIPGVIGYRELAKTENGKHILSDGASTPTGNPGFAGSTAKRNSERSMKSFSD